jgi:SAM-dependent methyltransferase
MLLGGILIMKNTIKGQVKAYYGGIAKKVSAESKVSCGCSASCCGDVTNNQNLYTKDFIEGLPDEAINASLGCANPVVLANPKLGETVLDLGSGGGIDVFISSKYVGESGKVYGLDMTDEMLELANKNKEKMEAKNVEFIKGYIEDIPLENETIDVITSNCVINLCESKEKALSEAYRVLKKGGRLAIADVVVLKDVPENIKQSVEMWVGCIAGALPVKEYEEILKKVGFKDIEITPVNIYTREIIEDIAKQKNLGDIYSKINVELVDGAFAGAHVKAYKL